MADNNQFNYLWAEGEPVREALKRDPDFYMNMAKQIVIDHRADDGLRISADQVYIVWFSKTLANWKALLSTDFEDGLYFELTYNGQKKETYVDVYAKLENKTITDWDSVVNDPAVNN